MKSGQLVAYAKRLRNEWGGYLFHDRKPVNIRTGTTNPGQRVAIQNVPMRPLPSLVACNAISPRLPDLSQDPGIDSFFQPHPGRYMKKQYLYLY